MVNKGPRIGPKMIRACQILLELGGEVTGKNKLTREVGPNGSTKFGDRVVMRCVALGLMELKGNPKKWTVVITDRGREIAGPML